MPWSIFEEVLVKTFNENEKLSGFPPLGFLGPRTYFVLEQRGFQP